ncbi:MSHA biogenesis protein MshP [Vibrio sp. 10N.286.49.B3]|uniref:MSHA biogenesis protein MshP n=1 Tax=Vibrio sp. 10N.286.49.B3 TaxID=1880855 RepID=UPI000C84F226|nr:MSHA biogenesis protein MshP [Vibrio sp. 10N.286.49.B3]PMH39885.1 MSHA biogenesis protein MshP [Vibrio sp. 10N.286.49.B3]
MSHKARKASPRKQRGSLYIVAIFVITVMGFLAMLLGRIQWSNHDALTKEQLGTQAWLLAHSSNEWALTQMYPLGASSAVSSACVSIPNSSAPQALLTDIPCHTITLVCDEFGTLNEETFYKLKSTAICGSGKSEVRRNQELWVKEESNGA